MWRDDAYLLDMLTAARKAIVMSEGLTFDAFEKSDLHQNAIVYVLQTIGEAATKVSKEFREGHTEIDWPNIIGLRNLNLSTNQFQLQTLHFLPRNLDITLSPISSNPQNLLGNNQLTSARR